MEYIEYEFEYCHPGTGEYQNILLECEVKVYPAEPDIGIMGKQAEIWNCMDAFGKDWYDFLLKEDIVYIEEKAVEKSYEDI